MTQATGAAMTFEKSALAQERLHELIPGGSQTYARGSDQYQEDMTPILVPGLVARAEDLDGNWLIQHGMDLGAITLGRGHEPLVAAVRNAAEGINFSRPHVWELRASGCFLGQVQGADIVKFTKRGSDTTPAAIKLARAETGGNRPWALWETSTGSEITTRVPVRTLKAQTDEFPSRDQTRKI